MAKVDKVRKRLEGLGIAFDLSDNAYSKSYREVKELIDLLLSELEARRPIEPTRLSGSVKLRVTGDPISCVTFPDGKTLLIRGRNVSFTREE